MWINTDNDMCPRYVIIKGPKYMQSAILSTQNITFMKEEPLWFMAG